MRHLYIIFLSLFQISNISPNTRVRELKQALSERGVKPQIMVWKVMFFCFICLNNTLWLPIKPITANEVSRAGLSSQCRYQLSTALNPLTRRNVQGYGIIIY